MVGIAFVPQPDALDEALTTLRIELLADPFLNRIPSFQPSRRKTAIAFHAKDDVPEVRLRVFNLLMRFDIEVFVAIRTKRVLVEQARAVHRYGQRSRSAISMTISSPACYEIACDLANEITSSISARTRPKGSARDCHSGCAGSPMARWASVNTVLAHIERRRLSPRRVAAMDTRGVAAAHGRHEDRYFTPLARTTASSWIWTMIDGNRMASVHRSIRSR